MFNTRLFKHSFALLVIIAVLFQITETFYLSWTFWWFDMVLHFLGGFWVSMVMFLFWNHYFRVLAIDRLKSVAIVLVGTILIGVTWEIFELCLGVTLVSDTVYWSDTFSDLAMDILGGFFGILYSQKLVHKNIL